MFSPQTGIRLLQIFILLHAILADSCIFLDSINNHINDDFPDSLP